MQRLVRVSAGGVGAFSGHGSVISVISLTVAWKSLAGDDFGGQVAV